MTVTFTVPGKPQGKGRPRFGNGRTYTPKKTLRYEQLIAEAYRLQSGYYFGTAALRVRITAFFPIPKSYTKKRTKLIMQGREYPQKKPDGDNIEKAVLDALNGIAYDDDIQVIELHWRKCYAYGDKRSECLLVTITDEVTDNEA